MTHFIYRSRDGRGGEETRNIFETVPKCKEYIYIYIYIYMFEIFFNHLNQGNVGKPYCCDREGTNRGKKARGILEEKKRYLSARNIFIYI